MNVRAARHAAPYPRALVDAVVPWVVVVAVALVLIFVAAVIL